MASLSGFFKSPTVAFVNSCKKDQLFSIASHYGIDVPDKCHKEELKGVVLSYLFDQGVLHKSEPRMELAPESESAPAVMDAAGLTFEQRKELLLLQYEQVKMQKRMDKEQELELERLRHNPERMKLDLERSRLQLIQEGKLTPAGLDVSSGVSDLSGGEVAANLRFFQNLMSVTLTPFSLCLNVLLMQRSRLIQIGCLCFRVCSLGEPRKHTQQFVVRTPIMTQ